MDRSELEALLGRVENATGPDSALAADIYAALGQHPKSGPFPFIPDYTASVDAALALAERCLPGWWLESMSDDVSATEHKTLRLGATVELHSWARHAQGNAATRPLAILSALLSALIAESHPAEPLKHMPA